MRELSVKSRLSVHWAAGGVVQSKQGFWEAEAEAENQREAVDNERL